MELSMGLAPIIVDELYNHVVQLGGGGHHRRGGGAIRTHGGCGLPGPSAMVMANGRIVQTGAAHKGGIGASAAAIVQTRRRWVQRHPTGLWDAVDTGSGAGSGAPEIQR